LRKATVLLYSWFRFVSWIWSKLADSYKWLLGYQDALSAFVQSVAHWLDYWMLGNGYSAVPRSSEDISVRILVGLLARRQGLRYPTEKPCSNMIYSRRYESNSTDGRILTILTICACVVWARRKFPTLCSKSRTN
jgi:hypothetical protein